MKDNSIAMLFVLIAVIVAASAAMIMFYRPVFRRAVDRPKRRTSDRAGFVSADSSTWAPPGSMAERRQVIEEMFHAIEKESESP